MSREHRTPPPVILAALFSTRNATDGRFVVEQGDAFHMLSLPVLDHEAQARVKGVNRETTPKTSIAGGISSQEIKAILSLGPHAKHGIAESENVPFIITRHSRGILRLLTRRL